MKKTRYVLWLNVDQVDRKFDTISSVTAARTVELAGDIHHVLDQLTHLLPASWRQLTHAEVMECIARRPTDNGPAWEQLSIF